MMLLQPHRRTWSCVSESESSSADSGNGMQPPAVSVPGRRRWRQEARKEEKTGIRDHEGRCTENLPCGRAILFSFPTSWLPYASRLYAYIPSR